MSAYHDGSRRLQDQFDSRRIADRLEEVTLKPTLTHADRAFIESAPMFFLATADADGRPDCSYKGGTAGFVRVLGDDEIAWPDYDGNGQFRSLGNVLVNPRVALLFIDWNKPDRLRVHGSARVSSEDALLTSWIGAQLVVRLKVEQVFPNCPRYIHRMQMIEQSTYVPCEGHSPPRPAWKDMAAFKDALPKK